MRSFARSGDDRLADPAIHGLGTQLPGDEILHACCYQSAYGESLAVQPTAPYALFIRVDSNTNRCSKFDRNPYCGLHDGGARTCHRSADDSANGQRGRGTRRLKRAEQDKRERHVCAVKALSAHRFSRHAYFSVRAVKHLTKRFCW